MTTTRRGPIKKCPCGKVAFVSSDSAEEAIRRIMMDSGTKMFWYWRDQCRAIHLTSNPQEGQ